MQRRTGELEPRQPRPRGHQRPQDLLRIGAIRQLELGLLAEVVRFRDQSPVREDAASVSLAAVEHDVYMLAAVAAFHFLERTIDDFFAARDDAQPVAQLLRVLHDVRREQHGFAVAPVVDHGIEQNLAVYGIERGERLI